MDPAAGHPVGASRVAGRQGVGSPGARPVAAWGAVHPRAGVPKAPGDEDPPERQAGWQRE